MYRTICVTWMMLVLFAGGGGSSSTETEPAITGALKKVSSAAEFEASLKAGFTTLRRTENAALSVSSAGGKLELFDVSVITQPLSRGSVILGDQGTHSEANHDRHAFTYQPDVNGIDRPAIPAAVYTETAGGGSVEVRLHLFEIHDKSMPSMASLLPVGTVMPPANDTTPLFQGLACCSRGRG